MRRLLMIIMIFQLHSVYGQNENFREGIKYGELKIKFAKAMTNSVETMRPRALDGRLYTGIQSFDEISTSSEAKSLRRLFPESPDPILEAKHRKHGLHLWYVLEIDIDQDPRDIAAKYRNLEIVDVAEVEIEKALPPNKIVVHSGISTMSTESLPYDDRLLPDQWHYNNTGQINGGIPGADINLFRAWETTSGANDVIVSVHDMGVDVSHSDLKENIWINEIEQDGTPGVDDDNNGYIDDINGWNFDNNTGDIEAGYHGTHVAGTIAAVNNNGIGVAGVAGGSGNNDGAQIMSIQMIGGGNIENGYIYAADNGAVISQNSWGYSSAGVVEESVLAGINYFIAEAGNYPGSPMRGGLVVFAAGNNGSDGEFYPGYYDTVLTVAATGPDNIKAGYSNFGSWIDITAPGGDISLGTRAGVLSTLPNDDYGYLDGTSMACPHVSGTAALVLASRDHQYTAAELLNQLLTSAQNIDEYNPGFVDKLGSGIIDAALALEVDEKIAPNRITDLELISAAQEFAILGWTVPEDSDDLAPFVFEIVYSTEAITSVNYAYAEKVIIKNNWAPGEKVQYEVADLFGLTEYHFIINSTDRWGNISEYSNELLVTTNAGPSIAVDDLSKSIDLNIDVSQEMSVDHPITILNNDEGLLRWSFDTRQKTIEFFSNYNETINYPLLTKSKSSGASINIGEQPISLSTTKGNDITTLAYDAREKYYTENYGVIVIGETDLELPNSAATKFLVNEVDGFNLTDLKFIFRHDPELGPVIFEIYSGEELNDKKLLLAQEYKADDSNSHEVSIQLDEQLYFQQGESFWIVLHVPPGNLYPLGIASELSEEYSDFCYLSHDLGQTWTSLETAIGYDYYAWTTFALSKTQDFGKFLSLDPSSGEVLGFEQTVTTLTAEASALINGNYTSDIILNSNDAKRQELRIEVNLNVTGHLPILSSETVVDYGNIFLGSTESEILTLNNEGLGALNNISVTSSNSAFSVKQAPTKISAMDNGLIELEFNPVNASGHSATITVTGDEKTHEFSVYGAGIVPPIINVNPVDQTITNIVLGDTVAAQITLSNNGEYPLKYYVPGWDENGIAAEISSDIHQYGYKVSSSLNQNEIPFEWNDITTTGIRITDFFQNRIFSGPGEGFHYAVPLEFTMPFYSHQFDTLYITEMGMVDFENSNRLVNYPRMGFEYGPDGMITALGDFFEFTVGGDVYYQSDDEKVIVQYEKAQMLWYEGAYYTFQIVIHRNGDINLYYKDIMSLFEKAEENGWFGVTPNRLIAPFIEDPEKLDGIQLSGFNTKTRKLMPEIDWQNNVAFKFSYPGPDIIIDVKNGSGVVLPGENFVVDLKVSTESLHEGVTKRSLNFISNDPLNKSSVGTVYLDIVAGGASDIIVNKTGIDFGKVFQGAETHSEFIIKNAGTAPEGVIVVPEYDLFNISGDFDVQVDPLRQKKYIVEMPTNVVGVFKDTLTITTGGGSTFEISIMGEVLPPPDIEVDLAQFNSILSFGNSYELPLSVTNTGSADLEFAAWGTEWLKVEFDEDQTSANYLPDFTYQYKSSKEQETEFLFSWKEIRKSGTRIEVDSMDPFNDKKAWRALKLPFEFDFYGVKYDTIYLGYNGLLTFSSDQAAAPFAQHIPYIYEQGPVNFIAPLWMSGGFDTYHFGDDSGIFYEFREGSVILTYSYVINVFGMGGMMSFQTILYESGEIKFQYRLEEEMNEVTSQSSTVGLMNMDGSDVIQISGLSNLGIGQDGLAIVVSPAKSYSVAPGETRNGKATLDASNIYAGLYLSAIKYQSIVPGKEILERPINLRVFGDPLVSVNKEIIELGEMLSFESSNGPNSYMQEFTIRNTGASIVSVLDIRSQNPDPQFSFEIYLKINGIWSWRPLIDLPIHQGLEPDTELLARVNFIPDGSTIGEISNSIIIDTRMPDIILPITGTVELPGVISGPLNEQAVSFIDKSESEPRKLVYTNNGGSNLNYEVSIEYVRKETSSIIIEPVVPANVSSKLSSIVSSTSQINVLDTEETFNRVLSYEEATEPSNFIGFNGNGSLDAATSFSAGPEGFNLTHLQVYFRSESELEATIGVEIAIGAVMQTAQTIYEFDYSHTSANDDEDGSWVTIGLPEPIPLAPNEAFQVVFHYPFSINYPQGVITDLEPVSNRYALKVEGVWSDLQSYTDFSTSGWLVRAAEETFVSSEWVSLTSDSEGVLLPGASFDVDLLFSGLNTNQGFQNANLLVKTNDPVNPELLIPLSLYLNQGPQFNNLPSNLTVDEGDTLRFNLSMIEPEGDIIKVENSTNPELALTRTSDELDVVITPGFESAGLQEYTIQASDNHGTSTELVLSVNVKNTNRAPQLREFNPISLNLGDEFASFGFAQYFLDPDHDLLSYTIASVESEVLDLYSSSDEFILNPKAMGEETIILTATDIYGATVSFELTVSVSAVLGLEQFNNHFSLYPNPATDRLVLKDFRKDAALEQVLILGLNGSILRMVQLSSHASDFGTISEIDISQLVPGIYLLRLVGSDSYTTLKFIKE